MPKRFTIAVLFFLLAVAGTHAEAYQQFGSYTVTLFSDPAFCGGWACRGCTPPLRFPIAQFTDGLLSNAKLDSVTVHWDTGNDYRGFTWQNIPNVTLDLNGVPLGTQTIYNLGECGLGSAQTYVFQSANYSAGFPGYVRGGTNTVYLTLQTDQSYVNQGTATISLNYELPPPFEFNVTDQSPESERRVILSNTEPGYSYPHFQAIGGVDGKVSMFVRPKTVAGGYMPNVTVYLRVLDPPDAALYMPAPAVNDNEGQSATIEGNGIEPVANRIGIWQGTSSSGGQVDFTLKMPTLTTAGNNYQVEAALDPAFPSGSTAKSGALTAWKRIFVEKRKMLRNGMLISAPAPAGASTIRVAGNRYNGNQGRRRIAVGDHIALVHAPALDRSDALGGWYIEYHTVADVQAVSGTGDFDVALGSRQGKTNTPDPLLHPFGPDPIDNQVGDGMAYLAGTLLTSADYFDAPDTLLAPLFAEAFAEYYVLPDTSLINGLVPVTHILSSVEPVLQHIADRWCQSVTAGGQAIPNHQLLVIADTNATVPTDEAGHTTSNVGPAIASFTFRGAIEQLVRDAQSPHYQQNPSNWAAKDEVHELAHQWSVDQTWAGVPGVTPGHCPADSTAYDAPGIYCLEATSSSTGSERQSDNLIARFHMRQDPTGAWQSEYLEIRRRFDPFVP